MRPLPTIMLQAVRNTRGAAAASSKDIEWGIGSTMCAGTTTNSAYAPSRFSPTITYDVHWLPNPAEQNSQWPHSMPGLIVTRWPVVNPDTPVPNSRTMPAASLPIILGIFTCMPGMPRRRKISM
jgi:hypothetical protein